MIFKKKYEDDTMDLKPNIDGINPIEYNNEMMKKLIDNTFVNMYNDYFDSEKEFIEFFCKIIICRLHRRIINDQPSTICITETSFDTLFDIHFLEEYFGIENYAEQTQDVYSLNEKLKCCKNLFNVTSKSTEILDEVVFYMRNLGYMCNKKVIPISKLSDVVKMGIDVGVKYK